MTTLTTVVLILCVVVVVYTTTASANEKHGNLRGKRSNTDQKEWEAYKSKYNKKYTDPKEDEHRLAIYNKVKAIVEKHNKLHKEGKFSYQLELNQFSDMDLDEIPEGYINKGYGKVK